MSVGAILYQLWPIKSFHPPSFMFLPLLLTDANEHDSLKSLDPWITFWKRAPTSLFRNSYFGLCVNKQLMSIILESLNVQQTLEHGSTYRQIFFNSKYTTTQSEVGWTHRCGTVDMEGQLQLHAEFLLGGGGRSVPQTSVLLKGQLHLVCLFQPI